MSGNVRVPNLAYSEAEPLNIELGGWWPVVAVGAPHRYLLYETRTPMGMMAAGLAHRNVKENSGPVLFPSVLPDVRGEAPDRFVPLGLGGVECEWGGDGRGSWEVRVSFRLETMLDRMFTATDLVDLAGRVGLLERGFVMVASGNARMPRCVMVGSPECPLRRSIWPVAAGGGGQAHYLQVEYRGVDRRPFRVVGGRSLRGRRRNGLDPRLKDNLTSWGCSEFLFYPYSWGKASDLAYHLFPFDIDGFGRLQLA